MSVVTRLCQRCPEVLKDAALTLNTSGERAESELRRHQAAARSQQDQVDQLLYASRRSNIGSRRFGFCPFFSFTQRLEGDQRRVQADWSNRVLCDKHLLCHMTMLTVFNASLRRRMPQNTIMLEVAPGLVKMYLKGQVRKKTDGGIKVKILNGV